MKNILPIISLIACTPSLLVASAYNIDFNTVDGAGGAGWNSYADVTDLVSGTTLIDTDSVGSSIYITATGDIFDSTGTNLSNAATRPAWVNAPAGDDFFWSGNDDGANPLSFTMTFGGLTEGTQLSLDLFASRNSGLVLEANYEYSLDGGTSWSGFTVLENTGAAATTDGWNTKNTSTQLFNLDENGGYEDGRYMSITGITILAQETLDVRVLVPAAANYAGINAAQLTVVPEPETYAFLGGLIALGYVAYRRRS